MPQLGFDLLGDTTFEREDAKQVMKELCVTCTSCRLSQIHPTNRGMIYRGNVNARIAVVGIAPGDTETEKGAALVGNSGKLFEQWMKYIGIDTRVSTFITNIIQCFTGDTIVEARDIQAGYRRWYSGPGIRVRTKDNVLTGTPNHPVLTRRGWVALCELRQGDYLVRGNIRREESTVGPNVYYGPTRFDEIFRSLNEDGIGKGVVSSCSDFHGDGIPDGDIDVVRPYGKLRSYYEPSSSQLVGEFPLVFSNNGARTLPAVSTGDGSFHQSSPKLGLASSSLVGVSSESTSASKSSPFIAKAIPFLDTTNRDSHPPESIEDSTILHASIKGQLLKALSSEITFSQVIEIESVELSEHVYNLQTLSSIYLTSQGFIVSNCQPPKEDKDENGKSKQRNPDKDEIQACFGPRCLRILRAMPNLEVVMTLGWVTAKALLGTMNETATPKTKTHEGQWFESSLLPGIGIFCLSHPAELLHAESEERSETIRHCLDYFKREYLETGKVKALAQAAKERREELGLGVY